MFLMSCFAPMVLGAITFRTAPSGIPHFKRKSSLAPNFQHFTQICCLLTFTAHQLCISIIQSQTLYKKETNHAAFYIFCLNNFMYFTH